MTERIYRNRQLGGGTLKRLFASTRFAVGFIAVALLSVALHVSLVSAQSTANTLKVSPVRSDVTIERGDSKTVEITVSNLTGDDISVRPSINDFVSGDESGTPALILDETETAPARSLKRFITPLEDTIIPADEAVTIPVVITVPEDADAGGYFGAVRFAPTDPDSGGQVNLSASVASLILLTVPGDITEKLTVTDFNVTQDGTPGSLFYDGEGVQATVRFKNDGNVQIGPFGIVSVLKGNDVVYETSFNTDIPREMVLPDGARRWNIPISNVDTFGEYKVVATFTYGQNNQTIEVIDSFWTVPWWVVIAAGVGLLLLIGLAILIVWLIRRSRKRRRSPTRGRMRL